MKKFLSIVLMLIMLMPTVAFGEESSTIDDLFYTNPYIQLSIYDYDGDWRELLRQCGFYLDLEEDFEFIFKNGEAHLDDILIAVLDDDYESVEWFFPQVYTTKQAVLMVMTTRDGSFQLYQTGEVTETGSVIFDMSFIPYDTYYVLFFSGLNP